MRDPAYIRLYDSGELEKRVEKAYQILKNCELCPHHCHVDRTEDEKGYCKTGSEIKIASYGPHFREEPPLVGSNGSGAIFFSNCNLRCVYCQNYDISHNGEGKEITVDRLADIMLLLQKKGCHNINFVTPSHMIYALLAAVNKACQQGLEIPLVYNSGGYDDPEVLKLLENVIDIYMPDIKYADEGMALKYSGVEDYFSTVKKSLKEMHRQVGDLRVEDRVAFRGLIIRHLILPSKIAGTEEVLKFIARELSRDSYVNIMKQYYPAHRAHEYERLNRRITDREYRQALQIAEKLGLKG